MKLITYLKIYLNMMLSIKDRYMWFILKLEIIKKLITLICFWIFQTLNNLFFITAV